MKKISFLDVGHGDCSVIYILNNNIIRNAFVIDIANTKKLRNELEQQSCSSIDAIIISHSDVDHSKGVGDFVEGFINGGGEIKKIIFNLDRNKNKSQKEFMKLLRVLLDVKSKHNVVLERGEVDLTIGPRKEIYNDNGEVIYIVYPCFFDEVNASVHSKSTNNMSIVCLCEGEKSTVLFTGDLESEGWAKLFEREKLKCDILKMPHHGAKLDDTFSIDKVLELISPKVAIISSGENCNYGHPARETIDCLINRGIPFYCTQLTSACLKSVKKGQKCCGDIFVCDNQNGYSIEFERQCLPLKCQMH